MTMEEFGKKVFEAMINEVIVEQNTDEAKMVESVLNNLSRFGISLKDLQEEVVGMINFRQKERLREKIVALAERQSPVKSC